MTRDSTTVDDDLAPDVAAGGDDGRAEARQLRLLNSLIREINSGFAIADLIDVTYERLREIVPYHRVAIAIYDDAEDTLELVACRADAPMQLVEGYRGRVAGTSLEPLIREREIRVINDLEHYLEDHPDSKSTRLIVSEGMRSSLTLPLVANNRAIGVMFFSSRETYSYRPEHRVLLNAIAGHMAGSLEKAALIDELRTTKEYLENILDNSADAIMVTDANDIVTNWNRGAERVFGYTAAEMIGQPLATIVPDDLVRRGELDTIRQRVAEQGYLVNFETFRLHRDGDRRAVSLTSTLFVDEGDTPPGRASIVRDVTDLRRMQEEIHRSQHLASIGEMGATIAHEIKNPLAGISGVIQVLRDELEPEDPRREVLGEVLSQVRRLDNTVHELLMFAKPWVVEPADCDLRETVETVARRTLEHHVFADASIRVDGDPRVIARVDRDTVEQVLWNLLTNAAQAAPDGGEIRCTVRRLPDKALVTVADRGGGIPVEIREHVLNPFFTTKTQGTGLGLSVCRKIMDAHKGMMTIVSTPGHGTEVRLEFPVEEES